jgi:outer membrane receptor protein involved in Fe transport
LRNYEIGAKGDLLDKRISFDTALYYIQWRDVQQDLTVPYGIGGAPLAALVNGQSASGVGVDFAVTARPLDGLTLGVTFGWNDLTLDADVLSSPTGTPVRFFSKGDRLNYSPEFTSGAFADYAFPIVAGFSGRFSVSGNYTSKQNTRLIVNNVTLVNTGDDLLIARASFAVSSAVNWSATLFVDNITNNYGAPPPFGFADPELSPRPRPRTIGVQLDYKY